MREKNFFSRLKVLSRPSGDIQWKQATRALILMVFAGLIAEFFGLNNGVQTIMFITLLATIIVDISLPLRKVIPLGLAGLFMTILAFTSASLALGNVYIFIFFTVLWSFFGLSTYIFGESVGYFGFVIFDAYFLAVILVNNSSSTPEWAFYCIISFLVASLLLIPRIWRRKKELRKMVAAGFIPQNSLKEVMTNRQALSGVPLPFEQYELFRIGTYLTGFRGYGKILLSRLSGAYQEKFKGFLGIIDGYSSQIAERIIKGNGNVNLENLDQQISDIDQEVIKSRESYFLAFADVAHQMRNLLSKANELTTAENGEEKENQEYEKISSPQTSLKEVLQANFNLKNMYIRHALRFTLAMTIGLLLVYLTHNRDVIWVTMGILIIIKPDITSTINPI